MKNFKKPAFTLIEILIALSIVGVVAILTVPNIVGSYNKKVYASSASRFYNQMTNAIANYKSDHRTDTISAIWSSSTNIDAFFTKYFDVAKSCGESKLNESECLASGYKTLSGDVVNSSGTVTVTKEEYDTKVVDENGQRININACDCSKYPEYENCSVKEIQNKDSATSSGQGGGLIVDTSKTCEYTYDTGKDYTCVSLNTGAGVCVNSGIVVFDVNGPQTPNVKGRDLFAFSIDSKGKINDNEESACTDKDSLFGCFTKLMENNWVMDY